LGIDCKYSTTGATSEIPAHFYRVHGIPPVQAEWHAARSSALGLPYVLEKKIRELRGMSFKDDPKSNFGW
jgi:hypothetical protein